MGVGPAKVVASFEGWKDGHVEASECQIPVVAPLPGLKREPVSSRLRQTLVHPDQSGILVGLRYSADGRRLIAGHYSSGIVQIWDASSGRQLNSIETGPRPRSTSEYFCWSPDGKFLYIDEGRLRGRSLPTKEKRHIHWDYSGGVRMWAVDTGKPLHHFPPGPGRGVQYMHLSPDGSTLLTWEGLSGDYESPSPGKWFGSLWDSRTGQRRGTLPENISPHSAFSPDSKTVAAHAGNDKGEATALLFLDAATGAIRRSLPVEQKHQHPFSHVFSPDGKLVACAVRGTAEEHWLKCWEVESGRETFSLAGEKKDVFHPPVFSPNGRMLAVCHFKNNFQERELCLIDVGKRKLVKRIDVGSPLPRRTPVFSPDGRWVAFIRQDLPPRQSPLSFKPDALPQPRILLIEAGTGEVRETIVMPPAIAVSLCFSPDGKTLASGGDGRVLLWDLTSPPGPPASNEGN